MSNKILETEDHVCTFIIDGELRRFTCTSEEQVEDFKDILICKFDEGKKEGEVPTDIEKLKLRIFELELNFNEALSQVSFFLDRENPLIERCLAKMKKIRGRVIPEEN